jgi:hypothetical protein
MDLPVEANYLGLVFKDQLSHPDEDATLCPKYSPHFSGREAIQGLFRKESICHNVEEIRTNFHCASCRMLKSLLSDATARTTIRTLRIDASEIAVYDEKLQYLLGGIMLAKSKRAMQHPDDIHPEFRLANVDPSTGTLDYGKIQSYLNRCKIEHCFDVGVERKRYRTSIDVTLVDVERMCLVRASTRLRYVALSYVCKSFRVVP